MWKRALLYWWPMPVFNTANVLIREFVLEGPVGGLTASQISVSALVVVTLLYTWLIIIKLNPSGPKSALAYGGWWLLFTVVAELIFSTILKGWSLSRFFQSFDFQKPLWLIVYLTMFLSPLLMYFVRRKAIHL